MDGEKYGVSGCRIKEFGCKDTAYNYGPELKPFRHGHFLDSEVPGPKLHLTVGSITFVLARPAHFTAEETTPWETD